MSSDATDSLVDRLGLRLIRTLRGLGDSLFQGLPLFRREMLAQSHRARTFILRVSFAVLLFGAALLTASAQSGTSLLTTAFGISGQGRLILDALVWMLFLAIYLFGPAGACGALTEEKERDTLFLLYMSRLGPWHVVLEKFLGRLVPLFSLLFLSLPLLAFSYAFGGLTREMVATAIWFLALSAIQVVAVSMMCSAICRSTARSFLMTYSVLFLMSFGFDVVDRWVFADSGWNRMEQWETNSWKSQHSALYSKHYEIETTIATGQLTPQTAALPRAAHVNLLCGPILFGSYSSSGLAWTEYTRAYVIIFYREIPISFSPMTWAGMPILMSSLICLVLARCFAYQHVLPPTRDGLWETLRALHFRIWQGGRDATVVNSGREILEEPREGRPIVWRESSKGFWSRSRNACLLLMLLEVPTLFVIFILASDNPPSSLGVSQLILTLWGVSVLLITVHASLLITKERSRQTLELLLTTPLTSEEIARQKFAGTLRLIALCAVPLLTCIVFQTWWRGVLPVPLKTPPEPPFARIEYFITALTCVVLYLPLVAWTALWMGLKYQHPTRATMAAMMAIGTLCLAPGIVAILVVQLYAIRNLIGYDLFPLVFSETSPITMLYVTEFIPLRKISTIPFLPVILNVCVYGAVLRYVRGKVLERADFFLGRKVEY